MRMANGRTSSETTFFGPQYVKISANSEDLSALFMTFPSPDPSVPESTPDSAEAYQGEERRDGAKDRRQLDKDRRDPERVADEIAPRRHPDIKGRRDYDE